MARHATETAPGRFTDIPEVHRKSSGGPEDLPTVAPDDGVATVDRERQSFVSLYRRLHDIPIPD